MRRLVCAIALCAASALAIPPAVVGNAPGRRVKLEVSDNFNRANGALGANWTGATLAINANTAISAGPGARNARWTASTFGANQYSEALFAQSGAPNSSICVSVRWNSSVDNRYSACVNQLNVWQIMRVTGGTGTTLTSCGTFAGPIIGRLEAIGDTLTFYTLAAHDGARTQRCQATDSTHTTGTIGMSMSGQFSAAALDNWYGGDL